MKAQFARLLQRHSEQESKTNDFVDECNEVLRTYSETVRHSIQIKCFSVIIL